MLESYSYGEQVTLDTPTTSQSHVNRLQSVPTLPLPIVNSRLTRVTFATKATPPFAGKSLLPGSSAKPRASSFNVPADKNVGINNKGSTSKSTEDLNFNVSGSKFLDLGEYLETVESQSHTLLTNLIIGAQDYDSSRSNASVDEWEELEMRAAIGSQGVPRENFSPSTLVMDHTTDNSKMPHCVINGEPDNSELQPGIRFAHFVHFLL